MQKKKKKPHKGQLKTNKSRKRQQKKIFSGKFGRGWKRKLRFPKKERVIMQAKSMKGVLLWIVEILFVCALAWGLVSCFGQRVSNAGDSMSPALKNGDVVLVNRVTYNARMPKRGDVIAFKPNGNENAHYSIKRVVGLPGETVQIKSGQIYINDNILQEDILASDIRSAGVADEPVELGEGEYFVMGDNHEGSDDSRMADVGNVRRGDIYGRVWFVASFGDNFGLVKK